MTTKVCVGEQNYLKILKSTTMIQLTLAVDAVTFVVQNVFVVIVLNKIYLLDLYIQCIQLLLILNFNF